MLRLIAFTDRSNTTSSKETGIAHHNIQAGKALGVLGLTEIFEPIGNA